MALQKVLASLLELGWREEAETRSACHGLEALVQEGAVEGRWSLGVRPGFSRARCAPLHFCTPGHGLKGSGLPE